jgi:hypothetical protein
LTRGSGYFYAGSTMGIYDNERNPWLSRFLGESYGVAKASIVWALLLGVACLLFRGLFEVGKAINGH